MSTPTLATVGLGLTWPDGTVALHDLDLTVPPGRTALVGANGTGKSTLLRLLAGEIAPTTGRVVVTGEVALLHQDLLTAPGASARAEDLLGITARRRALHRIEGGSTDPADFDALGDDWDVEERTVALLERLGLPGALLDRGLSELSGGEVVRVALAGLLLRRPDVLLLDEPTNNLDRDSRARLHEVLDGWGGTLLVVSHDRELLEHVDRVVDLRRRHDGVVSATWYGGGYTAYREQVETEQRAATQAVATARADVRRQQRDRQEAERLLAQRRRQGARTAVRTNMGKGAQDFWRNRSERNAADYRALHDQRLQTAREELAEAESRVHEDAPIHIDLPGTEVPRGRRVLRARGVPLLDGSILDLDVVGPERIAVTGPNGSGKTTLLRRLLDPGAVDAEVQVLVPAGVLSQRLDLLDDTLGIDAALARLAPDVDPQERRARLARFGFRGASGDLVVGSLSGGERLRATLTEVLLAEPPPHLLVLDEWTNNLDLDSLELLTYALEIGRAHV